MSVIQSLPPIIEITNHEDILCIRPGPYLPLGPGLERKILYSSKTEKKKNLLFRHSLVCNLEINFKKLIGRFSYFWRGWGGGGGGGTMVVVVEEQKILSLQVPNTSNITPSKCIIIFSTESILNWEFDNNLIEKQVRFHYVSIKLNFTIKSKVAESFIY